jgi:predicted AlkP superfamily pyrophosphatase or phosphodiesterase
MHKQRMLTLAMLALAACGNGSTGSAAMARSTTTALGSNQTSQHEDERGDEAKGRSIDRVLLISVDGLHQSDLARFIEKNPGSTMAGLAARGVVYSNAHTPTPSDSFPGLLALVTGGTPKSTGVYYDDSYDRTLFPPGSNCQGDPGTECTYFEIAEVDDSKLFSPINPDNLPHARDAQGNCKPVFPHEFIRTNTIFEVIRAAGGHTAWSDKHPAYDLVNGPSGTGVEDLYTPEINSLIKNGGTVNGVDLAGSLAHCDGTTNSLPLKKVDDYTTCEPSVIAYDDVKVQAVINEIEGKTSDGTKSAPVPNILGMNFQEVSVGQKLIVGGYCPGGTGCSATDAAGTPTPLLAGAIAHVDASVGRMVAALRANHLFDSTLIIVSAKHGQSPIDRRKLAMESGGSGNATVTDPLGFINAADPNVDQVFAAFVNPNDGSSPVVKGHLQTDDVGILWLQNQSRANVDAVVAQLTDPAHRAARFANVLPPGTIFDSNINFGEEPAEIYGDPTSGDPIAAARAPNVVIQPNWGVIYSGSSKKISEHGGGTLDDTNVALLVSNPRLEHRTIDAHVGTTQVAPTILRALDLDPESLDAVRKERTKTLPGLGL